MHVKMHCLCKSISTTSASSAVFPITSNVYTACRTVGFQRFFSSCTEASFLHILPAFCKFNDEKFCPSDSLSSCTRFGLRPSLTCKVSAAAYHGFISSRGLKSSPKRNALRNPTSSLSPGANLKKGRDNARKDPPANARGSFKPVKAQFNAGKEHLAKAKGPLKPVQAQKSGSSRQNQTEGSKSDTPVQAKRSSTQIEANLVQAKATSSSKQVQEGFMVDELEDSDEFDEELDDDLEDHDNEEEDEDFEDKDDEEDFDGELVEEEDADEELRDGDDDFFIDDMLDEEGEGVEDIMNSEMSWMTMVGKSRQGVHNSFYYGGGVNISQTTWGEKALSIAKGVVEEFGDNFSLYAFKASFENRIYVRLDKHSDKYGSPTMVEIESFSSIYGKRLEEAGQIGAVPDNIALEVSSPGAERVVQVPDQLMRFKNLPMLVRYEEVPDSENTKSFPVVKDSILELTSLETDLGKSVWKLANVKANREQAGKGRGLTKKQKEWRMELPLSSLRLVRLYMDI